MLAGTLHILSPQATQAGFELDYLLVISPVIGAGLLINRSSWRTAFREKTLTTKGLLPTTGGLHESVLRHLSLDA